MSSFFFRYTSLVDRYVPNIATGLKDSASLVRRQTLTLLTHLLQVLYAAHGKLNLKPIFLFFFIKRPSLSVYKHSSMCFDLATKKIHFSSYYNSLIEGPGVYFMQLFSILGDLQWLFLDCRTIIYVVLLYAPNNFSSTKIVCNY